MPSSRNFFWCFPGGVPPPELAPLFMEIDDGWIEIRAERILRRVEAALKAEISRPPTHEEYIRSLKMEVGWHLLSEEEENLTQLVEMIRFLRTIPGILFYLARYASGTEDSTQRACELFNLLLTFSDEEARKGMEKFFVLKGHAVYRPADKHWWEFRSPPRPPVFLCEISFWNFAATYSESPVV